LRTFTAHHDGIDLAYQRFGSRGDPLLLIMGIGAEMLYWHDDFCNALVERGFRTARFDNRDAGESTHLDWAGTPSWRRARRHPETAPYRLEDMGDDAAAVLDALGWPSAHIVGHSMGGLIAQMLAIRHRDRVRSLTSISSTPSPDICRPRVTTILRLMCANPADFIGLRPRGPNEAGDRLIRGHRVIGSPGYPVDEAWLRHIAQVRYARGYDPAARARQEAAAWASGDLRTALAALHVPTVVLHGQADPFVLPDGGIATAAAIGDATFVLLPGMGHDLPKALWPCIIDHMRAVANKRCG
jgi:pimeloyl-ACP methyl ester carboxylesterase